MVRCHSKSKSAALCIGMRTFSVLYRLSTRCVLDDKATRQLHKRRRCDKPPPGDVDTGHICLGSTDVQPRQLKTQWDRQLHTLCIETLPGKFFYCTFACMAQTVFDWCRCGGWTPCPITAILCCALSRNPPVSDSPLHPFPGSQDSEVPFDCHYESTPVTPPCTLLHRHFLKRTAVNLHEVKRDPSA